MAVTDGKTVKELRKIFADLVKEGKGDFTVLVEGCDCVGFAGDVRVSESTKKTVVITRSSEA